MTSWKIQGTCARLDGVRRVDEQDVVLRELLEELQWSVLDLLDPQLADSPRTPSVMTAGGIGSRCR